MTIIPLFKLDNKFWYLPEYYHPPSLVYYAIPPFIRLEFRSTLGKIRSSHKISVGNQEWQPDMVSLPHLRKGDRRQLRVVRNCKVGGR